jgi:hypothetical protein
MAWRAILLVALLLAPLVTKGSTPVPQVLQDSKTKVIYYLESDRRHVSAIDAAGKLLWCCEVFPVPKITYRLPPFIDRINWDGDDIAVAVWTGKSGGYGKIDKQTGVYSLPTITQ